MCEPTNIATINFFMGIISYSCVLLPSLATIKVCLMINSIINVFWNWRAEYEAAVQKFKAILSSDISLIHFNPQIADHSFKNGVGAIISRIFPIYKKRQPLILQNLLHPLQGLIVNMRRSTCHFLWSEKIPRAVVWFTLCLAKPLLSTSGLKKRVPITLLTDFHGEPLPF